MKEVIPQDEDKIHEEKTQERLKKAVTGIVFQRYFATVEDINGPTVEGYKKYIQTIDVESRDKFLALLEDPEIIKILEETISIMSGGGGKKQKHIKRRKTNRYMKSRKHKKTIKKRVLCKHKKTIKKRMLHKHKKTIKKRMLRKHKK